MNKEFLGDRRRALEEEYFAKLNRALRDKLRAAEAAAVESHDDILGEQADARNGDGHRATNAAAP